MFCKGKKVLLTKIEKIKYEDIKDIGLGAIYEKSKTVFRVFAPDPKKIELKIGKNFNNPRNKKFSMKKNNLGIFEVTLKGDFHGYFYSYIIDDVYEITDPYSYASSINSMYSIVCDLRKTDPVGFRNSEVPKIKIDDAIIYELNVKNYTADKSSNVKNAGKYLGLCEKNRKYHGFSTGIDNIIDLGITHVQLLPIFDFFSVDEASDKFFDDNNYNWGYDPELYFVPEGSYSTNPKDPLNRIYELKKMIESFHQNNIAVVMDVVFNHTFKSYDSNLYSLCKYYYRLNEDETFSNGSGVGNELASERSFVRKLIIDCLKFWVSEYKIDGFRFDLMGLIDIDTMKIAVKELRKINPNIIIYGEPWFALSTTLAYEKQSLKGSQKSQGFGVFNDIFRDAIKGDTESFAIGYIQGDFKLKGLVQDGIAGSLTSDSLVGFTDKANESINYLNCHDNLILYDKLQISLSNLDKIDDYVKLSMGIIMLSYGIPFLYEGNEFNHSKKNDRNSYNSPLFVNAINWADKETNYGIFTYTKDLIALRKSLGVFSNTSRENIKKNLEFMQTESDSTIIYKITEQKSTILIIINSKDQIENIKKVDLEKFLGKNIDNIENIFSKEGKNTYKIEIKDALTIDELSVNAYKIGG